ncbi:DNA alkylation repair protein [Spongiimicrobium salis]|uniref:DNA alkylation repair protein n=1 Tax=Spongiimicrobium salis TaxID=1667022 RepID=UPI00374DA76A
MNKDILNRKGARKAADIPAEVVELLNKGKIETVNLTEWLAIDHNALIQAVFPDLGIEKTTIDAIIKEIQAQKKPSAMNTTRLVGTSLSQHYSNTKGLEVILDKLSTHLSDSIRCYAPYLIALNENLTLEEKMARAQHLVADTHFGVREVVWMALRPEIDKNLEKSIQFLATWTKDKDENIRRFTTEATRPRGVWCKHIDRLKETPELALPILNNLKADDSKYVQDSVGNWLNDASKTRPDFVIALCEKWQKTSPTKATEKIIKRAKRTIDKG